MTAEGGAARIPDGYALDQLRVACSNGRLDLDVGRELLAEELRRTSGPTSRAELDQIVRGIVRRLEAGVVQFEMEVGRTIRWTPGGVSLIIEGRDADHEVPVIDGLFRPKRTLLVEGDPEPFREVDLGGGEPVSGRASEILERLERSGRVLSRRYFRDVAAHLFRRFGGEPVRTHATYGIYVGEGGVLQECTEPTPTKPEQIEAHAEIREALRYEPTAADVAAYFDLDVVGRFAPHEVLPLRGYAAIAPFNPVLRGRRRFSGHVFSEAKGTGLGKSMLGVVYSEKAYGRTGTSAEAIRSSFRFPATADAACVPQAFSEASDLDPRWFESAFKVMPEAWLLTKRGNSTLDMVSYNSRATFFLSANSFPLRARPHLVRTIRLVHEETMRAEREAHKSEVDDLVDALTPVGPFVARSLLEAFPTESALLGELARLEEDVKRAAALLGWSFVDLRRAQTWATVLLGLEGWDAARAKVGLRVGPSLSRREFFERVIARVEGGTFEGETTALGAFRSYWSRWRALNTVRASTEEGRTITEVRGRGSIWDEGWLDVQRKPSSASLRLSGYYVTQAVLDDYRQSQVIADLRIGSIAELARLGLREAGLNEKEIQDEAFEKGRDGHLRARRHSYPGGEQERSAFVPHELVDGSAGPSSSRQMVCDTFVVSPPSPLDEEWLSEPWSKIGLSVVLAGLTERPSQGVTTTHGLPSGLTENGSSRPKDHEKVPTRMGSPTPCPEEDGP